MDLNDSRPSAAQFPPYLSFRWRLLCPTSVITNTQHPVLNTSGLTYHLLSSLPRFSILYLLIGMHRYLHDFQAQYVHQFRYLEKI